MAKIEDVLAKCDEFAKADAKGARDPSTRFSAGQSVRFRGNAANGTFSGDMPVKIINPWSNRDRVTHFDKRGVPYEGASTHIPTATVERPERKGAFPSPAKQFEAHHFTLSDSTTKLDALVAKCESAEKDLRPVVEHKGHKLIPAPHGKYSVSTAGEKHLAFARDLETGKKMIEQLVKADGHIELDPRAVFEYNGLKLIRYPDEQYYVVTRGGTRLGSDPDLEKAKKLIKRIGNYQKDQKAQKEQHYKAQLALYDAYQPGEDNKYEGRPNSERGMDKIKLDALLEKCDSFKADADSRNKTTYKGYLITFNFVDNEFQVWKDGVHITTQDTLPEAKAAIDAIVKEKK